MTPSTRCCGWPAARPPTSGATRTTWWAKPPRIPTTTPAWSPCTSADVARLTGPGPVPGGQGLLPAVVHRQPVGQPGDPERLGVPVSRTGQDQLPARRLQPFPVTDDDRERAGVHEVHGGQIENDPPVLPPGPGQEVVELAAGHDVQLAPGRHDQAFAATLRREPELRHIHLRISLSGPMPRHIVCWVGRSLRSAHSGAAKGNS